MDTLLSLWHFIGQNFTAIIAVCALALTIYEIKATRRHNYVSVKPMLTDHSSENKNENDIKYSFIVKNNGLGAGIIESFDVYAGEQKIDFDNANALKEYMKGYLPSATITNCHIMDTDYVMAEKETCNILDIEYNENEADNLKSDIEKLDKLSLIIKYKSMYGEQFTYRAGYDS